MSIAQKEREERRAYLRLLPSIVEALVEAAEPVALSAHISEEGGIDQRTAYRWIQLTEEAAEKRRKRDAILPIVLLWLGALTFAVLVIGRITARLVPGTGLSIAVVAGAAAAVAWAALRLRGLKMRSYRRWLREERADEHVDDEP